MHGLFIFIEIIYMQLWFCIYEEISMVHEDKSSIRTYRIVDVDYCGAKLLLFALKVSRSLYLWVENTCSLKMDHLIVHHNKSKHSNTKLWVGSVKKLFVISANTYCLNPYFEPGSPKFVVSSTTEICQQTATTGVFPDRNRHRDPDIWIPWVTQSYWHLSQHCH